MSKEQFCIEFNPLHAVRASDAITSIQAAEGASRFAAGQAGRIFQALKLHGPRTAHELSQLLGLTVVQICRRLPELKAAKLADVVLCDDGITELEHAGFRVWRALS